MNHSLALALLLVPVLVACSSPPQQDYSSSYRIGSESYKSGIAAEAALKDVKPKQASGTPSDKKIRLLRAPMPSMPKEAIDAGLSDLVTVEIVFNQAGDVESVVPKSYSYPVLLQAVLAVVRQWKIEPPVEANKGGRSTVRQSFRFEAQ